MNEIASSAAVVTARHRIRTLVATFLVALMLTHGSAGKAQSTVDPALLAQYLNNGGTVNTDGTTGSSVDSTDSSSTSGGYSGGTTTQSGMGGADSSYTPAQINNKGSSPAVIVTGASQASDNTPRALPPAKPGEFELWLQKVVGHPVKRFGSELMLPTARSLAISNSSTVPPGYALNIGDVVSVAISGSIEGSANFEIDRNGEINIPKVGAVKLAGVRYRDLKNRISEAIGRKYRGYEVSVSIAKLRGIQVFVTGFANHPGAWTANSLATLADVMLATGGPSAGGSFRSVKLYRNGQELGDFDLYRLLREGDRSNDPVLHNGDVLFIPPVGHQVAVVGSVNDEAIYELKDNETLQDALRFAGGTTSLADQKHLMLYRLSDADTVGNRMLDHQQAASELAQNGDIIEIPPEGSLIRPLERQQALVRIEGEVKRPGNYYVSPGTPLSKVLAMAGGLTSRAYVFGTEFYRASVRVQQRAAYSQAIDQMETQIETAPLTNSQTQGAAAQQLQINAARAYLDQLRATQPKGRMVLNINSQSQTLPGDLIVENNDRIVVPPRIDTVSVFGAVYRPATFLLDDTKSEKLDKYVDKSGGTIRGADKSNIFVVRANGEVVSKRHGGLRDVAMPGDTIFVPIKTQSNETWARIKDITSTLFNLGLGAAAIKAIF